MDILTSLAYTASGLLVLNAGLVVWLVAGSQKQFKVLHERCAALEQRELDQARARARSREALDRTLAAAGMTHVHFVKVEDIKVGDRILWRPDDHSRQESYTAGYNGDPGPSRGASMRSRSGSPITTVTPIMADTPDKQRRLDVDALDLIARHLGGTRNTTSPQSPEKVLDVIAMIVTNTGRTIPGEEQ